MDGLAGRSRPTTSPTVEPYDVAAPRHAVAAAAGTVEPPAGALKNTGRSMFAAGRYVNLGVIMHYILWLWRQSGELTGREWKTDREEYKECVLPKGS